MERLGRYEILEELGRGAMGRVYKARDPQIDRLVAIKLMLPGEELPSAQVEEWRARFQREARAVGRLTHPHIVALHDLGEAEGRPYLVMEYVQGQSLEAILGERRSLPAELAVALTAQVAEALDYAHRQGIVHRDVKPGNILVTGGQTAKVTDFGIARLGEGDLTRTGFILGSPSYMSPEQVSGLALDGRSDLFGLGAVLYELLSGEKAFPGETISTITYRIVHEEPTPLKRLNPAFPAALDACLRRALAKDPARRYARGADLARELRGAVALGTATAQLAPTLADGSARPARPPAPKRAPPPPPPPRRGGTSPWLWAGVGLLVLGLGLGLAVRSRRPAPPPPAPVAAPAAEPEAEERRRAEAEALEAERRRLEAERARLAQEQAALERERQRAQEQAARAAAAPPAPARPPDPPPAPSPAPPAPAAAVRFVGNRLISSQELEGVVGDLLRQPSGPETLGAAARRVAEHYHARGYVLARAIPRRPEATGGAPEIAVFEGQIGQLRTAGLGPEETRAVQAAFRPVLEGGVVEKQAIGQAIRALGERHGLVVKLRVEPGRERGTADLVVERSPTGRVELELGGEAGRRLPLRRDRR